MYENDERPQNGPIKIGMLLAVNKAAHSIYRAIQARTFRAQGPVVR